MRCGLASLAAVGLGLCLLAGEEVPAQQTLRIRYGSDAVKLWETSTGQELVTLHGNFAPVDSVAFSPNGQTLASTSNERAVCLWDIRTGKVRATLKCAEGARPLHLAFTPGGERLAVAGADGQVVLWDMVTCQPAATFALNPGGRKCLASALTPDARFVAYSNTHGDVRVCDVQDQKVRFAANGPPYPETGPAWDDPALALTADGKLLASTVGDGAVTLWDVAGGKKRATLREHTGTVRALAFTPDGRYLASGGTDRTVQLWDVAALRLETRFRGHPHPVLALAFTPNGRQFVSGSSDGTVRFWDVPLCKGFAVLEGHTAAIRSLAFSPNGRLLASGSQARTLPRFPPGYFLPKPLPGYRRK